MNNIDELLRYDPIAEAEKITRKGHWSNFSDEDNMLALLLNMKQLENSIRICKDCKLCQNRNKVVIGEGNKNAKIMFIGEGPGADEDIQGRPFVGRAGKLMDQAFKGIGIKREEVYIAICEQLSDPKASKGLVDRDVIRVITPGTVIEDDMLDDKANNFPCALRTRWLRR